MLPQHFLHTIYKSFVQPNPILTMVDVFYYLIINQTKVCVKKKYETIQYNAALAITGAIKGTSQMKLLNELGLESLEFRQWFRKLSVF